MTTETPPEDWILIEAATRFTWLTSDIETLRLIYEKPRSSDERGYRALCDMIAKHEKPPLERKLACAREAAVGHYPNHVVENIATRAIELWEEGFGK
jgi:hypothetical protein